MGFRHAAAAAVAVTQILLGAPAAAQETAGADGPGPAAADEAEAMAEARAAAAAARAAAEGRLALAQQRLGAATARAGRAEGRRAAVEGELVAAVVEHRARRTDHDAARAAHGRRVEARRAAQQRRRVEHDRLVAQVVETYKLGAARSHVMAVEVLQRGIAGEDVAAALYEVESVVDHQLRVSLREKAALEAARAAEARALRAWEAAVDAVWAAGQVVAGLEAELDRLRASAQAAEARTIDAMAGVAATQEALDDLLARQATDPRLHAPGEVPGPAAPEAQPPSGQEADPAPGEEPMTKAHVAARARSLARGRALTDADLAVRTDLGCPVLGATFSNDWHYPRHPHRLHEGTDLFAPEGTPVRAVADGTVVALDPVDTHADGDGDLGGISVSYETAAGDRWYNAHLSAIAPGLEVGTALRSGQHIGTVGDSGNAAGTPPHLHLGLYVGRAAVNPWPTLELACAGSQPSASTSAAYPSRKVR